MPQNNAYITLGPAVASSGNNIALAQSPLNSISVNGALGVNNIATLDIPRRIQFTFTADESAGTVTINGTNRIGQQVQETFTPPGKNSPAGTAPGTIYVSKIDYATVFSITNTTQFNGYVTVGTCGAMSSQWFAWVLRVPEFACGITLEFASGTNVSATVEHTNDDVQNNASIVNPVVFQDVNLVGITANATARLNTSGVNAGPFVASRLTFAGYVSGSVQAAFVQARYT